MNPLHCRLLWTMRFLHREGGLTHTNKSGMASDNMEVNTAPKKRVYIILPKKHMAELAKTIELDHGLLIKDLNPYLNEGYIQAYFREWGTVTSCKIKKNPNSGKDKGVAFVRFSAEEEADTADWAGPHYIGGSEVTVKRFVSPKIEEDLDEEADMVPIKPPARRSMGVGYILEDAQWLDDDTDD